jgi:NAD+ kinase
MRILLVANKNKEEAALAALEVVDWLAERNTESVLVYADTLSYRLDRMDKPFEQGSYDIAVTFGGDGTLLRCSHAVLSRQIPVLGVNFGNLGFLTGADASELYEALDAGLNGKLYHEQRATLRADIMYDDGRSVSYDALNELALTRGNSGSVIHFDVFVNETHLSRVSGDGMIVNTATGSTAYALSAGGPLINPQSCGLAFVPIAPHSLVSRAVVAMPGDTVTLQLRDVPHETSAVFIDGETIGDEHHVERIIVSNGPHTLDLLRYRYIDFYAQASHSFFGGIDG